LAAAGSAGAGLALPANWAGLAMVASGLSADSSAQYCSSESLSHSLVGQSSLSSRLPRRLLLAAGAGAALRCESVRPASGLAFAAGRFVDLA
jgi:hypothetical protein